MKVAKKISTVLKALGWVVLALALVVNIYAAANSGAAWSTMQGVLNTYQVNGGIFARQCFDRQYFTALRSAAVTKGQAEQTRIAQVRADLSVWDEALAQAKEKHDALEARYMAAMRYDRLGELQQALLDTL